MYDVFLPGDYFFDLIFTGLPEFPMLGREVYGTGLIATGGALFITAVSLHRLGINVGWSPVFGNDYYSQYVRDLAIQEGLDLSLAKNIDAPYRRVSTSIPYEGERAFVTYIDPELPDLHDLWLRRMDQAEFKHLHLGAILTLADIQPLAEKARSKGATISMDCQDMPDLGSVCVWKDVLSMVDVFMPNAREALLISGTSAVASAIEVLMGWVEVIVIKDGANGAWIGSGGKVIHAPAIDAGPVVDTTGAGDCFNAGFLLGYVVERAPLDVCAGYGNICGGLSVTKVGGATGAPTHVNLMEWLSEKG